MRGIDDCAQGQKDCKLMVQQEMPKMAMNERGWIDDDARRS
jgi:hypothetical protein